ncbi:MAG: MFS transporter [Alicyclobacillus sp.]|nr:MFS transporter [Alicyclobacillus sp.]
MNVGHELSLESTAQKAGITRYAYIILIATFLGWMLDAMDSSFFSLVLKPAVTDILGGHATTQQIAANGSVVMTTYLLGWATGGILLGVLTDYLGRVRLLTIGILMYSIFTGLCALSTSIPQLAFFRFMTGLGSGPEFAIGATLITEVWQERHRAKAIGVMMSGYSVGYFVSALIYYILSSFGYGWRAVFVVGVFPALLILLIRATMREPEKFLEVKAKRRELRQAGRALSEDERRIAGFTLAQIFSGPYRKATIVAIIMTTAGLIGSWAIGGWIPTIVNELLSHQGLAAKEVAQKVSIVSMMYNGAAAVGYALSGFVADWIGRKWSFTLTFVGCTVMAPVCFLALHSYIQYIIWTPFLGFFIFAYFGLIAIWLAEIYPTQFRGSGSTFCLNISRYLVAFAPLLVAPLIPAVGSISHAAAVLSLVFPIGFIFSFFVQETKGARVS